MDACWNKRERTGGLGERWKSAKRNGGGRGIVTLGKEVKFYEMIMKRVVMICTAPGEVSGGPYLAVSA